MHIPKHYEVNDSKIIEEFIKNNAFGELVSVENNIPVVTHMPFIFDAEENTLSAHMGKLNPHWKSLDQQSVLVILNGPHDYISPNWYSKASVPTWNYQTVHITGRCVTYSDTERLQESVNQLSQIYESQFDDPWQPEYNANMLRAIVGLEIDIESIQCAFKLNQGKSDHDRLEVAKQLELRGNADLAKAMRAAIIKK